MNQFLKKPKESMICKFMTCLNEQNDYLELFRLPSHTVLVKKFDDMDIASNVIPHSWRKTMAMHDFDPLIHALTEFTLFCKQI